VNEGTNVNFQMCGISFLAWSGEILEIVLLQVGKSVLKVIEYSLF
jgi:hypothetical protein